MKFTRIAIAAVFAFAYGNAYAFHSGGVAECEGCHSMHNSYEGAANVTGMAQYQSGPYLLKAQDQSGACLNCHEPSTADAAPSSYHISTVGVNAYDSTTPVEYTPGGDFAWLKKTMSGHIRATTTIWEGDRHGHNIVAGDFGYAKDGKQITAPGGTYPAANLACSSCHDPHGKYRRFADGSQATTGLPIFGSGSYATSISPIASVSAVGVYRLLAGVGYQPKSLSGSFAFGQKSPDAVAPSTYNRTENVGQTHVAYGQGMSEWCSNCHGSMLENGYTSGMKGLVHPAGNAAKITAPIIANYNSYVSVGVMTIADASNLASYDSSTTENKINTGYSVAQQQAAYGNRAATVFGPYARNYCNKCHAKD